MSDEWADSQVEGVAAPTSGREVGAVPHRRTRMVGLMKLTERLLRLAKPMRTFTDNDGVAHVVASRAAIAEAQEAMVEAVGRIEELEAALSMSAGAIHLHIDANIESRVEDEQCEHGNLEQVLIRLRALEADDG